MRAPSRPRAEFLRIAGRTGLGFVVMGFIGFFVKLVLCVAAVCAQILITARQAQLTRRAALRHSIPINHIIIGGV
jgi:hypothetical protein